MTPKFDMMTSRIMEGRHDESKYAGRLYTLVDQKFFNSAKRYIISNDSSITPKVAEQEPVDQYNPKPNGLWYALGDGWANWLLIEEPSWTGRYVFEIELDYAKMLCISPPADIKGLGWKATMDFPEFAAKYAEPNKLFKGSRSPHVSLSLYTRMGYANNWEMVSKDFSGVENYFMSNNFGPWAVESGCVWNPDAVKSIRMVMDMETMPEAKNRFDFGAGNDT
ncbi:MAG: hypothetical protein WCP55_09775 [Lentisphaerota bacterium]